MDTLAPKDRSKRMSLIRDKDKKPEIRVRRLVHSLGYRYRLHCADLPGNPDIVLRGRKKAIFVNGCFWHMHENCTTWRLPKSRVDFWKRKLEGNKERDRMNQEKLVAIGWDFLVVWECEIMDKEALTSRIIEFLEK